MNNKFKQTEIGEIPEDWKVKRLDEVCVLQRGFDLPITKRIEGLIPVIASNGITGYHNISKVKAPGVVTGRSGKLGNSFFINKDFWPLNTTLWVKDFKDSDPYFVYLLLGGLNFEEYNAGSSVPTLNRNHIHSLKIAVPKFEQQQQITSIFSSLDDKIELNRKMNKTLEEIGKALFKRWFVDFEFPDEKGKPYKSNGGRMADSELGEIPEGWEVKTIGGLNITVTDFVANGSFASLKKNTAIKDKPDYALFLRNTDLKADFASGYKYVDKHSYEFLAKTKLYGGEVIISNVGDVGSVYRCPFFKKPMTLGNNQIVIKAKENNPFFYLLFKSFLGKSLIGSITSGSVQNKFNKTDFRNLQIVWPQDDIHQLFLNTIKPLYKKIEINSEELKNIISLRDSLLPRLMNGKLRVN